MLMAYKEQLKNGKWQRLRLSIMERDDFKCRVYGSENDLNVHHLYYEKNVEPWNYEPEVLVTLCGQHHVEINSMQKIASLIAEFIDQFKK